MGQSRLSLAEITKKCYGWFANSISMTPSLALCTRGVFVLTTIPGAQGIAQLATTISNGSDCQHYLVWVTVPFQRDTSDNSPQYSIYHDNNICPSIFHSIEPRYLGICTPAFSHAWIKALPCSTMTFLPSIVISISALREVDAENARDGRIRWRHFVCRWAEMTALRRNISFTGPFCCGGRQPAAVLVVMAARIRAQLCVDYVRKFSQSEQGKSKQLNRHQKTEEAKDVNHNTRFCNWGWLNCTGLQGCLQSTCQTRSRELRAFKRHV